MKVLLFGATGMIGQGVLRECLLDPGVDSVVTIGRSASGQQHPKLHDLVRKDLLNFSAIEDQLRGFEACFFCLGVTSAGMNEEQYRRVTYDITLAAAQTLAKLNPLMTFIYVSGMGADSSEQGRVMWARVRGKAENDLLKLPCKGSYVFRPAVIVPLHGTKSRTTVYRVFYSLLSPILPLLHSAFPKYVSTTESVGRAMLKVARNGAKKRVLENGDINERAADRD